MIAIYVAFSMLLFLHDGNLSCHNLFLKNYSV